MVKENTKKNKHLTPEDRKEIEECLSKRMTFKAIGVLMDGDRRISFAEMEIEADEPQTKIDKAEEMLQEMLADGPAQIDMIFEEWDVCGIGDRTVRRAAKELGVISRSRKGVTTWELPAD